MNWDSVSFDWNQARAFLATVEEGSLSGAARVLRQTQPTLGRQVTALEEQLGVVLFERVGRSLVLTESGHHLAEHVRAMGEAANRLSLTATGQSQAVEGTVRITCSEIMAVYQLPKALKKLRQMAPSLEVDVVASNDIQDIQRREADIAIRHVRPEQPELIARLATEQTASMYAARTYLDARGRPTDTNDLKNHDFISFGDPERMIEFLGQMGLHLSRSNFRLNSESGLVAWQMTKDGLGIAFMVDEVAMVSGEVERVLPDREPITFPIWLTTHKELHTSRRIRVVYDLLYEFLAGKG